MKRITLLFLSMLTAHAGQTLALTSTAGQSKAFYVVGCTPKTIVCKQMAADKQTFEIPMDQLAPGSIPEALQKLATTAAKLSARIKTGTAPLTRSAFAGAEFDSKNFVNKNLKGENQISFKIRGKVVRTSQTGFFVVKGMLIDYNNDKTKRAEYPKGDPRKLSNKTETDGEFIVYNLLGAIGDNVDVEVYPTGFMKEFILAGKAKDALAACEAVMVPLDPAPAP